MPTRLSRAAVPAVGSRRSRSEVASGLVVLAAVALLAAACSSSPAPKASTSTTGPTSAAVSLSSLENWPTATVALQETGSSLLFPLFNLWVQQIAKEWPSVSVQTASTGSGAGVTAAETATANIGASDAYLAPAAVQQYPDLENIPVAISAQQVNYNIPGLPSTTHLKLSAKVLAGIYQGSITNWDSPKITSLNPGVTIPKVGIVPIHRADSSGDTFLFTSFLSTGDPSGWTIAPDTTVTWPNVPGALTAMGNGGMVTTCQSTPGCAAYVGVSYLKQATAAGLGYAALQNKAGSFETPTAASITAEAQSFTTSTPASGTISMIYGSQSNGYPIVNYEYAIVSTKQPNALAAQAVKAVLAWAIDPSGGASPTYLDQVGFVALPSAVQALSTTLVSKVSS
ncbi:MAG TPA: phosphate ABC transporter substrate-binding protein PstS [Acidimicrobiales bacterium]|nr:phosphate ABC transporter substrate-binding protein PstS [Acidimicrobiales bacterium]